MKKTLILSAFCALISACGNNCKQMACNDNAADNLYRFEAETGSPCNVSFGGVTFTRALNGADKLAALDGQRLRFEALEKQDFFNDPDGKLTNNTAPVLLTEIDNTKPFTLTAQVTPEFKESGLYDAAVLYIYANPSLWQKFCYEQDERGRHRVVTVRTVGTSDDNNHDVLTQPTIWMRLFSDTQTVAFYYSLDGSDWQMVRLYQNNYPERIFLGISNQCPQDKYSVSYFESLSLSTENVSDIRMGN